MSKQGKPILILRTHFVADGPRSSFFLLLQQVADFREQLHFLAGLRRFCGSWHLLFLAMELRDEADEDEDGEGDDDEIKRGLQERPNQGRETTESGTRDDRIWDEKRMCNVPRSTKSIAFVCLHSFEQPKGSQFHHHLTLNTLAFLTSFLNSVINSSLKFNTKI